MSEERLRAVVAKLAKAELALKGSVSVHVTIKDDETDMAVLVAAVESLVDSLGGSQHAKVATLAQQAPTSTPVVKREAEQTQTNVTAESGSTASTTAPVAPAATPAAASTTTPAPAPTTAAKSTTVVYEGALLKLGGGMFQSWQPRHFWLYEDRIEWALDNKGPVRNSLPKTQIKSFEAVDEKKHKRLREFSVVTTKKTYFMQAPDEASYALWSKHLGGNNSDRNSASAAASSGSAATN